MDKNTEQVKSAQDEKKSRWEERQERRARRWEERREHGGNIVPAFFFILLGFLFLMNNLGILPWYIWSTLWRFWPVILILIGIQILVGKSVAARIIMTILAVFMLLAIIWYVFIATGVLSDNGFNSYIPRMGSGNNMMNPY